MSFEKDKSGYEFTCDACGEVKKPPRFGAGSAKADFLDCWDECKREGWRAVKVKSRTGSEEWEHRCPECA